MALSPFPALKVHNRQRSVPIRLPQLQDFAEKALQKVAEIPPEPGDVLAGLEEISVAILSDRAIARFHQQFMGIPGPTDVLTFQHGEILLSAQTAAGYALEYGQETEREICLYILHGLLHLRGFDDTTPAAHQRMHRVQNALFAKLP